jgi:hypothetical protein
MNINNYTENHKGTLQSKNTNQTILNKQQTNQQTHSSTKTKYRVFLHRCKQFVLQYVLVKPLLALSIFIGKLTGTYHDGSFVASDVYLWTTLVYNISITVPFICRFSFCFVFVLFFVCLIFLFLYCFYSFVLYSFFYFIYLFLSFFLPCNIKIVIFIFFVFVLRSHKRHSRTLSSS